MGIEAAEVDGELLLAFQVVGQHGPRRDELLSCGRCDAVVEGNVAGEEDE